MKDSLDISILYSIMLWEGYFSENGRNLYSFSNRRMVEGFYGLDVLSGNGLCLNYSDMLSDLLITSGFGSALLINSLSKDMEVDYKPNIEMNKRQISIKDKIMLKKISPVVEEVGTHAFVLINDKGLYYIFDPTNLTIFSIDDMDCKNINGQGGSIINPIFSYMMNIDTDRTSVLDDFILSDFKFKEFVSKE